MPPNRFFTVAFKKIVLAVFFVFISEGISLAYLPDLDGILIDKGTNLLTNISQYDSAFVEKDVESLAGLHEGQACYGFPTLYEILNSITTIKREETYDANYITSCYTLAQTSEDHKYLSYIDCSTCSYTRTFDKNMTGCSKNDLQTSPNYNVSLSSGSYKAFYNPTYSGLNVDGKWMCDKCNITALGSIYDIVMANRLVQLKSSRKGSVLVLTGNLNMRNNSTQPSIQDFAVNGIKPKILAYTYDKYIVGKNYYERSADVSWEIPVSVQAGETILLQPSLSDGYGNFIINSIKLENLACTLSITSLTGNNAILTPASGGSIAFSGSINESSGQPVSWTLNVLGKTFTGSGNSVSATWDGKLADGTVVAPGSYSATLSATTADGQCTDSKTANFTVTPAPDGQCGLYVQFGSSAHLASGNLSHSQNLFTTQGGALPLGLTLYYNSLDPTNGAMGRGWSHSYSYNLKENSDGSVLISEPNWKYRSYSPSGTGYNSTQTGNYVVLAKDSTGFTLTEREGTVYRFNTSGQLASITDRNGNSQTFSYTGNNLISITDPAGHTATLGYDSANHLTSIIDQSGNSYTLAVGATLSTVTQPDNSIWQYSYDTNSFMLGKVDPLGNSTSYSYDDQHRVIGSTDPEGKTRSITYPQTTETVKTTTFTEKDGNSWSYSYDTQQGYLLSKTDPQSGTTSYQYDANGNRTATTNPDGTSTSTLYDNQGNLLSSTDAAGNSTSYSYNSFGQATSITDPQGGITRYSYDAKGNLTSLTDPAGASTSYQYDSKGNMTKVTDAAGQSTSFSYNAAGNMISVTDASGATTNYSYDAAGNITTITDAKGGITKLSYDNRGRLIKSIDPQGNSTSYTYDKNGNKLSDTDANGNSTRYEYNSRNQLIKTIDALGNVTTYAYGGTSCPSCGGGVDKLTALTDANNNATRYDYDNLGRLTQETDPLNMVTSYNYDSKGNLTSKTDAKGQTISYSYDANNRLVRKNFPDTTEETFSYDSKGNILTAANKNISYSFSYDIAGRMLTATDSTGQVIQYGYDSAGRKTVLTYPDGTNAAYSYDSAGRLAKITSNGKAYSFSYDSLGRRTKLGYPNGASASYSYDSTGKLTSLSHKAALGLPIDSFSYTHDKVGNRLSIKQLLQTINYSYDPLYRLTQAKPALPLGSTEQYSYDPVGNRISGPKPTLTYLHNQANQLTEETGNTTGILAELFGQTAVPTGKASYNYDQNGNLITKTEPTGLPNSPLTTLYSYDFENRLIQTEIKFGQATVTTSFSYDPFGRRISKKTTGTWCLLNGTDSHNYTYDGQNIILEQRDTNITGADFTGTTRYLHGPGTDEPLSLTRGSNSWYYHADGLGSIIALSNKYGIVIDKIDYDSFGNRKPGIHLISQPYSYTGREWDKETGLYYYRARYYDPSVGRFIAKDPIGFGGGINVYAYVQNNPVNWVDPSGLELADWCLNLNGSTKQKICQNVLTPLVCLASATACCELQYNGCMGKTKEEDPNCEIKKMNCTAKRMECMVKAGMPDRDSPVREPLSPYPEGHVPTDRTQVPVRR